MLFGLGKAFPCARAKDVSAYPFERGSPATPQRSSESGRRSRSVPQLRCSYGRATSRGFGRRRPLDGASRRACAAPCSLTWGF